MYINGRTGPHFLVALANMDRRLMQHEETVIAGLQPPVLQAYRMSRQIQPLL